jgi:phosphogluconate dehydratase
LRAESRSYHAPGTCTFYGTANSNQMMMELMGLHVPNAAFINPGTPLRQALTRAAVHRLAELAKRGERPLAHVVDEKAIVNAMVGLVATGGSTNHFIHLPAIARAAGIVIDWHDFAELSSAVPLIARVYPNGSKDVNDFQDAGGMAFASYTLSREGLIHTDTLTAGADSRADWLGNPELHGDELIWKPAEESADIDMLRPVTDPFQREGGVRLVQGNLWRAVFKTSAVDEERWVIEAPARCFSDQNEVLEAFKAGELQGDIAVVVRFQGPRANGMPELHKLVPTLGVLQDRGQRVALITDGRMSGASGKVPAAIHVSPEALPDGPLARVRDGDVIRLDGNTGQLEAVGVDLASRPPANSPPPPAGTGRELFALMRNLANEAEMGASAMLAAMEAEQA